MSKIAITQPPVRSKMVQQDGTINPAWAAWFTAMHKRVGAEIGAVAVEHGGTGATSASGARSILGVPVNPGDIGAAPAGPDVDTSGHVTATHLAAPLAIDQGGTGAGDVAGILAALGMKYQQVALTATPNALQGSFSDTAFAWTAAFTDGNYVVLVTLEANGAWPAVGSLAIYGKSAAGFTIRLTNVSAAQNGGVAHCFAVHL